VKCDLVFRLYGRRSLRLPPRAGISQPREISCDFCPGYIPLARREGGQCEEAVRWKVLRLATTIRFDRRGIFSRGCRDNPAPSNRAGPDYHAGHGHESQVRGKIIPPFLFSLLVFSRSIFFYPPAVPLLALRRLSLSLSLSLSLGESRGKSGTRRCDWTSAETRKFLRGIFPRACHIFDR